MPQPAFVKCKCQRKRERGNRARRVNGRCRRQPRLRLPFAQIFGRVAEECGQGERQAGKWNRAIEVGNSQVKRDQDDDGNDDTGQAP